MTYREPLLNFDDYIKQTRKLIATKRTDLPFLDPVLSEHIVNANCPYNIKPPNFISGKKYKYGALLIHGLLDCPFSLRDIAESLALSGIYCRSILLPGHGTHPSDLVNVNYQDWYEMVEYGVKSLQKEVDFIFLIGYSTGAILSIQYAFLNPNICGLILLSPALYLRGPSHLVPKIHALKKWLGLNQKPWLYRVAETDYVKYQSIALNGVTQVYHLIQEIAQLTQQQNLHCPIFLIVSIDDETISSKHAIKFFTKEKNPMSKMLLYTAKPYQSDDKRVIIHSSHYPSLHIKNFSHVCIPFAPTNIHYGQHGDYFTTMPRTQVIYGAYNRIEILCYDFLFKMKILKLKREILTYNPDFYFMIEAIHDFIIDSHQIG